MLAWAASISDLGRAEEAAIALAFPDSADQAGLLADLAVAAAQAGDPGRAARLAADAERLARDIADPHDQGWTLSALVTTTAEINDLDRAEALARAITDPPIQMDALSGLALAVAGAGDPGRAEALARCIANPGAQAKALTALAAAIWAVDPGRAARLAAGSRDRVHHGVPGTGMGGAGPW